MVILSESVGTKSASAVVLVLKDPEPELFDLGRAAFVPKQARQSRAPIDLKFDTLGVGYSAISLWLSRWARVASSPDPSHFDVVQG